MANLSGQTIQSTYPGLLNLNTATSGISSSIQSVTDGYGNATGTIIATNYLSNPSIFGIKAIVPDYGGVGFNTSAVTPPTGNTNNNLYLFPFYDMGFVAYSAITTAITNVSTTSDVMNMYIYNSQYLSGTGYGVQPYQQLYSGTTLPTTGATNTGRVTPFTQNISFSGSGPGVYYLGINITNGGVSPTVRYGGSPGNQNNIFSILEAFYGITQNATSVILSGSMSKGSGVSPLTLSGGIQSSYSSSDILSKYVGPGTNNLTAFGFALNTAK
jgi:hypothetical protein